MKKIFPLFLALILSGCQASTLVSPNSNYQIQNNTTPTMTSTPIPSQSASPSSEKISENVTAIFKTSMGDIEVKLFPKSAPKTVANFIGLANGTKEWKDPKTGEVVSGKSLYAGTIFHRVIPDFMIQGGDPKGTGMGGPGYQFADEFDQAQNFSEPYMLAMANSGPDTNGSQFFITVAPTTWLNNKHTIFGKVIKGKEVVDAIANAQTLPGDKPTKDITLKNIEIVEEK
jgi:peptidyl-prolyl cis-trans isomerase A (cyclophilin A)